MAVDGTRVMVGGKASVLTGPPENVPVQLMGPHEGGSGALLMPTLTTAVCVKPLDVPVTVTVAVPVAAVSLAVTVNTLALDVLAGLNDAVTPVGKVGADKFTLPVNPF